MFLIYEKRDWQRLLLGSTKAAVKRRISPGLNFVAPDRWRGSGGRLSSNFSG